MLGKKNLLQFSSFNESITSPIPANALQSLIFQENKSIEVVLLGKSAEALQFLFGFNFLSKHNFPPTFTLSIDRNFLSVFVS